MKRTWVFIILATAVFVIGCGKKEKVQQVRIAGYDHSSSAEGAQRKKDGYLAYEHKYTIDVPEDRLSVSYKRTLDECARDAKYGCTVLNAKISTGEYPTASIRMRIKPEGIKDILEVASSGGKIVEESTHVEDLAKPIVDNKRQVEMLEGYRARLLELQKKAANDVDALIKISSELARVQADLELATGDRAFLAQRVNMDVLTIAFGAEFSASFSRPIRRSLSSFAGSLSEGIGGTITAVAYILPGASLLAALFFSWRYLKRRRKK
jgi:hypothetical protein